MKKSFKKHWKIKKNRIIKSNYKLTPENRKKSEFNKLSPEFRKAISSRTGDMTMLA